MTLTQEVKDQITKEFEEFKAQMYAGKTKEERSKLGQFFTPPEISIRMIERFNCDSLAGKKILDPACGSGNLLAACLIAGADPEKVFGNDYDQVMVDACRARLQKINPKVQDWQIHQGNALHKFAVTYFGEDYDEMYFEGKTQPAARNRRLNDEQYNAYLDSQTFKDKYKELHKKELDAQMQLDTARQAAQANVYQLFNIRRLK